MPHFDINASAVRAALSGQDRSFNRPTEICQNEKSAKPEDLGQTVD
jgi:hypothetical protein